MLADGMAGVARFYPVHIDPKVVAWLNFAGIAGTIYGTRFVAIRARMRAEARTRPQQTPGPVAVPKQAASSPPNNAGQAKPNGMPGIRLTNPHQLYGQDSGVFDHPTD